MMADRYAKRRFFVRGQAGGLSGREISPKARQIRVPLFIVEDEMTFANFADKRHFTHCYALSIIHLFNGFSVKGSIGRSIDRF